MDYEYYEHSHKFRYTDEWREIRKSIDETKNGSNQVISECKQTLKGVHILTYVSERRVCWPQIQIALLGLCRTKD